MGQVIPSGDTLNNLALLLHRTNRLAEAEPLFRRALALSEASYGRNHPQVAIRLNNLAALLCDTKRRARPSSSFAARWQSTRPAMGQVIRKLR